MNYTIKNIKLFFSEGHERTLKAKKNIATTFLIKGGSICISLYMVPLTINYVNPTQYGIWLTLSSIIVWFSFFDIGFGNGLKNKLSEAIARGDEKLARIYISTTYLVLILISAFLYGTFLLANTYLDWSKILNTPAQMAGELSLVALIIFSVFAVQFVLQLINVVCEATQNTRLPALSGFLGNLLGLLIVLVLSKFTQGSLLYLCLSIGISPLVILFFFTIFLYSSSFSKYKPSYKLANLAYAKDIMQLGIKFFVIQLGLIFFYNANNLIIAQVVGPEAVTPYNIAFKYFAVITMVSGIIMLPFWAAFNEANARQDYEWIKNAVRKLEKICLGLLAVCLVMLAVSPFVYKLWVGEQVAVPFALSAVLAFYTVLNAFRTIYCFYLNGVGKIQVQLYLVLFSGLLNVPLAFYLGSFMGATGVILSTTILCVICAVFEVTQYRKLIRNTATGIWNK